MDVYTKSCWICRELVVKAKYLDANEHKELMSEVGNQVEQAEAEDKSLRVKSSLRGSNTSVSGVANFES